MVRIGSEHEDTKARDYSVISASYDLDGVMGNVGIIGPRRIDYGRMIPLVEYVATLIAKMMKG